MLALHAPSGDEGKYWREAESELFGGLKVGLLKALNISARNCTFMDSRILKFLNSEKSRFLKAGPTRMALPELP